MKDVSLGVGFVSFSARSLFLMPVGQIQTLSYCSVAWPLLPAVTVTDSVTLCIHGPQLNAFLCKLLRSWCSVTVVEK